MGAGTPAAKFTQNAAQQIVKATNLVLNAPTDQGGDSVKRFPNSNRGFWANVTSHDDSTPIQYAWTEQYDSGSNTLADKTDDGGRSGTTTDNFAINANESDDPIADNTIVYMVLTFDNDGNAVWRFNRSDGIIKFGTVSTVWSPGSNSITLTPTDSGGTPTGADDITVNVEFGADPQYCAYQSGDIVGYVVMGSGGTLLTNKLPAMSAEYQAWYYNGSQVLPDYLRASDSGSGGSGGSGGGSPSDVTTVYVVGS